MKNEFTDISKIDVCKEYRGRGEKLTVLKTADEIYDNTQGCYYDGKTAVQAFTKRNDAGLETAILCVYDSEGNLLKYSGDLDIHHANNVTFIPEKNAYHVSHCQGEIYNIFFRYSLVDADTLKVTETKDLEYPFFSMAYSPEMKRFASGEWGGETLDVWDCEFNNILHTGVEGPLSLSQGVWCDSRGIWFVRSKQNGVSDEIRWYDWNCKLNKVIGLTDVGIEPEAISVIGDNVYVISRTAAGEAGIYRIVFSEIKD